MFCKIVAALSVLAVARAGNLGLGYAGLSYAAPVAHVAAAPVAYAAPVAHAVAAPVAVKAAVPVATSYQNTYKISASPVVKAVAAAPVAYAAAPIAHVAAPVAHVAAAPVAYAAPVAPVVKTYGVAAAPAIAYGHGW